MPYMLIRHKVRDYAKWKPIYDAHGVQRKASGEKSARLFRSAGDPNEIVLLFEWDSLDNARRFIGSEDLRQAMQRAGVADKPDVFFLEELR